MIDATTLAVLGACFVLGVLAALVFLYIGWRHPCTYGAACLHGGTVLFYQRCRIEPGPHGQRFYTHEHCLEVHGP